MSVYIVLPGSRIGDLRPDRWVYLGKNTGARNQWAKALGADREYLLGDRINRIAREIRSDFIQWVAKVGAVQPDRRTWWATRLSSKSPFQTDAHLLISFAVVFGELIDQFPPDAEFLFVVEDPWLYRLLKEHHASAIGLHFVSPIDRVLIAQRVRLMLRGVAARLRLSLLIVRQAFIFRRIYRQEAAQKNPEANGDVWIYSPAEPDLFQGETGIDDKYMPGLGRLLGEGGFAVRRLTGLLIPRQLQDMALRHHNDLNFLLDGFSLRRLWDSLSMSWTSPDIVSDGIRGISLKWILEREIWMEFGSANLAYNLLYYNLFKAFFENQCGRCLFFFFEGLPWEKMMILAKEDAHVRISLIGHQHSAMPFLLLNYFPDHSEWAFIPRPDLILANSRFHQSVFEKAGYPASMVASAGSLRYGRSQGERFRKNGGLSHSFKKIYVSLPYDHCAARDIMGILIAHASLWSERNIHFLIKPHPDSDFKTIGRYPFECPNMKEARNALTACLDEVDGVLYSSGALGLEALVHNIPAISYVSENSIALDPARDWFPEHVESCDRSNLAQKIAQRAQRAPEKKALLDREFIFGSPNESLWLQAAGLAKVRAVP